MLTRRKLLNMEVRDKGNEVAYVISVWRNSLPSGLRTFTNTYAFKAAFLIMYWRSVKTDRDSSIQAKPLRV